MTVVSGWLLNASEATPGQSRAHTRLAPASSVTPLDALSSRSGIVPGGTPMLLTGSVMTGSVSTGRAYIQGTSGQGVYPVAITVAEPITVANGHASLPRIDSVFLIVYDKQFDTSGLTVARVDYVQGTAAASPTAPSAPATSNAALRLWDILVPANASAGSPINWGTALTDQRTYTVAAGGIGIGSTGNGAYVGQYRDTGTALQRWNGSAWEDRLYLASGGRFVVGADTEWYRNAANTWRTPDSVIIDGSLTVSGVGGWSRVEKSANQQVISSTTLVNDTHLVLALAANATYELDGWVPYDGQYNAGDMKADWSLPAGATMLWSANAPATGGAAAYNSNTVSAGTPISIGTYGTGGSYTNASPRGRIVTSATAGNLQFRWAQNVSNPVNTTVYAGAWIRLLRTA